MKQSRMRVPALVVTMLLTGSMLQMLPLMAQQATQDAEETPPDMSSVWVETLELEPTVVKTGDVISQTYRVHFPDLISEGREIIILEDRMAPENLPVHPFEGISLDVQKRQVGDEHIWDFEYGLRLIAPDKAFYVLPGFSFYYFALFVWSNLTSKDIRNIRK